MSYECAVNQLSLLQTLKEYYTRALQSSALSPVIEGQHHSLNHLITVQVIFVLWKAETEKLWGKKILLTVFCWVIPLVYQKHFTNTVIQLAPVAIKSPFVCELRIWIPLFKVEIKYSEMWDTWDLSVITTGTNLNQSPFSLLNVVSVY